MSRKDRRGRDARFTVVHAPGHGPSWRPRHMRAAKRGADSVAFSEAYHMGRYLRSRPSWRMFTGSSTRRDANGRLVARDVAILVHRRNKILASGSFKAANESTPLRIAPERWTVWVVFRVGGPDGYTVAHVALHPHAAVADHWDGPRAGQYRAQMTSLVETVRRIRREYPGVRVVVSGDLNYPDKAARRALTPVVVFRALGLHWKAIGIDYMAHTPDLQPVDTRVVPRGKGKGMNGQDHPWIVRVFRPRNPEGR